MLVFYGFTRLAPAFTRLVRKITRLELETTRLGTKITRLPHLTGQSHLIEAPNSQRAFGRPNAN